MRREEEEEFAMAFRAVSHLKKRDFDTSSKNVKYALWRSRYFPTKSE
jgi:hypothetical protein